MLASGNVWITCDEILNEFHSEEVELNQIEEKEMQKSKPKHARFFVERLLENVESISNSTDKSKHHADSPNRVRNTHGYLILSMDFDA